MAITQTKSEQPGVPTTKCPRCGGHGHWARDCTKPRDQNGGQQTTTEQKQPATTPRTQSKDIGLVTCYNCNEKGHFAYSCPKRLLYCGRPERGTGGLDGARQHGTVNGVYCQDILVDTGATQTVVHKNLVTDANILDEDVSISCVHGDTTSYPLATVKINIAGKYVGVYEVFMWKHMSHLTSVLV